MAQKIARKFTESVGAYRDKVFLDENIIPQRLTLSEKLILSWQLRFLA